MRWLQVTDLESNVHLALLEGDKVRILREPHDAVATVLDLLEAEQAHRLEAESWVQSAEHAGVFDRFSWADLVGERLAHRLTVPLTPPEVWGAGVTYKRSADFREEGSGIYDKVYSADRPELFFKSTASRCAGSGQPIGRRRDSTFTATEPELAIVIGRGGAILGFTLANDVSAWDIERENPLYLPQSKVYNGCFAFGPVIVTPDEIKDPYALELTCRVDRGGREVFS
ncbi:MAG TPA: fumarylacetoacetate hydrolase family protein, partial [Vicinamibacteria bacterium]|nr:fumarylacetoacetate hydrolase family protein [Vicinamibacteria bacterium]